jgi:hypothetical protein
MEIKLRSIANVKVKEPCCEHCSLVNENGRIYCLYCGTIHELASNEDSLPTYSPTSRIIPEDDRIPLPSIIPLSTLKELANTGVSA